MLTLKGRSMKMTLWVAIGTLFSLILLANPERALAHGDTIRLSYARVQPERLVVVAGTTVHFHNANQSGAPCTVVIDEGKAQSPILGRAEGWHYTFENAGTFSFFIEQFPSRGGKVIVTPDPKSDQATTQP
jgi:plastocyanin